MAQPQMIFHGVVRKGKIAIHNQDGFAKHLGRLEGKAIEVVVRKFVAHRTSPQNRYYWGVVIPILAEQFGYENGEELHKALKAKFLTDYSGPLPKVGSTAALNVADFADYLDRIMIWAGQEHGCVIPPAERIEAA